jgi:small GTP-binding protein
LSEIKKPETKPLNEAKILVVGDERVGKTSVINRIIGRKMNIDETSTLGIDIQRQPLTNDINVNFWDFAGQEITHQTHQFFLSSRCLYLYVIDSQKEDNDSGIFHWLNTIKAGAENSPIIVVVNKRDLNPSFTFDINRYKQEFNIVAVVYISTKDEDDISSTIASQISSSIKDLICTIELEVSKIQDVKLPFPPSWLSVKEHIENLQKSTDFIESAQYEQVCAENGIIDSTLQDTLLSILNQIGTIVTYKKNRRLNVMQIINPEWVTNGVYKIVRSPLINETATLSKQQFKQIFANENAYEKERHYTWLIDLVKKFQLAFTLSSNQNDSTILIPSRLDSTQPKFEKSKFQIGLNFRFQYSGILKKSVMHQFIVQMHEYVSDSDVKYWQRGIFLTYNDANAVVISDEENKTISISLDRTNRSARELLVIIRHCLRRIHDSHFKVTEQVPLFLHDENDVRQIVGFENYVLILEAEEEGDEVIRLAVEIPWNKNKSTYKFQISELLDGYRIEDNTKFDYKLLRKDLFEISCLETENRHAIFNESEDQTNDRYRNALLNRNYHVADQSRGGESESGKSSGERDIVVRNRHTGIAESIIESLQYKQMNTTNIKKHVAKLVKKYDTLGNKENFVLNFVKSKDFLKLWENYKNLIPGLVDENNDDEGDTKSNIKIGISMHGGSSVVSGNQKKKVTHFFVNFYSEQ